MTAPATADPLEVELPTGSRLRVLTPAEADFVNERVARYQSEFAFTNVSDQAQLDQAVTWEMLMHRYNRWLAQGATDTGSPIDEGGLRTDVKNLSLELRQVKKNQGMDKLTRDRQRGDGSVHDYISKLLQRAKAMGINREHQLDRALELVNELIGMVTFYRNANDDERVEFGLTAIDILNWIWDRLRVEYDEIDEHFRSTAQRYWIREV